MKEIGGDFMAQIKKRAEAMMKKSLAEVKDPDLSSQYQCLECQDKEFLILRIDGVDVARDCKCREEKKLKRRFKNALIPEEFQNARFDNYKQEYETQKVMYQSSVDYLKVFETIKSTSNNSFGFMAVFGEQRLKELPYKERAEMKAKHNNFGLGKTHLQAAMAKWLINHGHSVLMVSDVTFMDDLTQAKMARDEGVSLAKLLNSACSVDVLVWDDIGKSKYSEAKESLYYNIINDRYRNHKPILFSSNEDDETLADKIGFAAASRLFGMSKEHLYEVEGTDYRTN